MSAGARVDARRTCQEPRLTDHARPHGSDLAFDLSIIASLDGSRSQPPVPAAENPAMRDAAALLGQIGRSMCSAAARDTRLRRAGRDRSADLRVTRWAKDESEAGAVRPSVVGQTQFLVRDARPREHRQTSRRRPHFRASSRRRPIDPSRAQAQTSGTRPVNTRARGRVHANTGIHVGGGLSQASSCWRPIDPFRARRKRSAAGR